MITVTETKTQLISYTQQLKMISLSVDLEELEDNIGRFIAKTWFYYHDLVQAWEDYKQRLIHDLLMVSHNDNKTPDFDLLSEIHNAMVQTGYEKSLPTLIVEMNTVWSETKIKIQHKISQSETRLRDYYLILEMINELDQLMRTTLKSLRLRVRTMRINTSATLGIGKTTSLV